MAIDHPGDRARRLTRRSGPNPRQQELYFDVEDIREAPALNSFSLNQAGGSVRPEEVEEIWGPLEDLRNPMPDVRIDYWYQGDDSYESALNALLDRGQSGGRASEIVVDDIDDLGLESMKDQVDPCMSAEDLVALIAHTAGDPLRAPVPPDEAGSIIIPVWMTYNKKEDGYRCSLSSTGVMRADIPMHLKCRKTFDLKKGRLYWTLRDAFSVPFNLYTQAVADAPKLNQSGTFDGLGLDGGSELEFVLKGLTPATNFRERIIVTYELCFLPGQVVAYHEQLAGYYRAVTARHLAQAPRRADYSVKIPN